MKCRYGDLWDHVCLTCFSEPLMKFTNLCELRKWTFNAKRLYWTFQPDEIVETPWILMILLFWNNLRNKSSKTIERKCSTCIMSYLDRILNAFRNINPQNMNFNGGKRTKKHRIDFSEYKNIFKFYFSFWIKIRVISSVQKTNKSSIKIKECYCAVNGKCEKESILKKF